jgi:hypothetical protein
MIQIDKDLVELTKEQIDSDFKDIDSFTIDRLNNFRMFIENHGKCREDIISIFCAVHEYRQVLKFELFKKKQPENFILHKIELINMYYDICTHVIASIR